MTRPEIICIGSTSKDIFFPTDEAEIIETPEDLTAKEKIAFELGGKYRVADRYEAVGGVAANVSFGLARQGCPVAAYSKVGDDDLGRFIIEEYQKARVDTSALFVDRDVKTDLSAIIVLTQNGERTIFHNRDANERLEILEEKLLPASWFFVSALNGPWQANLVKILSLKKKGRVKMALNPGQHNIKENPSLVRQAIAQADILILNKDEALELLRSDHNLKEADESESILLDRLHALGAHTVGLTDGKRGAWASAGQGAWHAPSPPPKKIIDSTGAGDAFSSAFFGALLDALPLEAALRQGVANGLSVLQFYGASVGLLDRPGLEKASHKLGVTELK